MNDTPTHAPAPAPTFAVMPTVQKYGRQMYSSYSSNRSASYRSSTAPNDGGGQG